jgi:hypothetical protein
MHTTDVQHRRDWISRAGTGIPADKEAEGTFLSDGSQSLF